MKRSLYETLQTQIAQQAELLDQMHDAITFGRTAGEDVTNIETRYHNLLQKHNRWKSALAQAEPKD